jgi:hypothetical protein
MNNLRKMPNISTHEKNTMQTRLNMNAFLYYGFISLNEGPLSKEFGFSHNYHKCHGRMARGGQWP